MAEKRKLQQEVEKTLKRVEEGLDAFNDVCEKMHGPVVSASQKEKFENELKREIKKLQRLRDQIKTWQTSSDIKDKAPLDEARKKIEREMERFKVCERESKMKAFSKEGLAAKTKLDPQEEERNRHREWLNEFISTLNTHVDAHEAEEELLMSSKKGKHRDHANTERRLGQLQLYVQRHRWHINNMELILRRLENDSLDLSVMDELKESIELYLDNFNDDDFFFDETLYAALNLDAPDDNSEMVKDSEEENTSSDQCGDSTPPSGRGSQEASGAAGSPTSTASVPSFNSDRTERLPGTVAPGEKSRNSGALSAPAKAPSSRGSAGAAPGASGASKGEKGLSGDAGKARPGGEKGADGGAASGALSPNGSSGGSSPGLLVAKKGAERDSSGEAASPAAPSADASRATNEGETLSPHASGKAQVSPRTGENGVWTGARRPGASLLPAVSAASSAPASGRWAAVAGGLAGADGQSVRKRGASEEKKDDGEEARRRSVPGREPEEEKGAAAKDKRRGGAAPGPQGKAQGDGAAERNSGAADPKAESGDRERLEMEDEEAQGKGHSVRPPAPGGDAAEGDTTDRGVPSARATASAKAGDGFLFPGTSSSLSTVAALVDCSQSHRPTRSDAEQIPGGSICGRSSAALGWGPNMFGPGGPGARPLAPLSPQIAWTCAPESFPDAPLVGYDSRQLFAGLDLDTLFFVFYYQQGTYQQYLAARELKQQSWRYHKKYLTWFQRHEEPRITADKYEQGTYVYFDYDSGWCSRIKQEFTFEYHWLEDELAV
ncbi:Not1 N-terminal domain, CCR4-Not complex component protein [Toxoplasma gondii p89]|uniref:Not1 N-terminal domain, CCR4-Not complex component protein n=1 Tax=Toxoplasma gondii p89 TaxID=943119 RepID=A0A086L3Q4_TOXGO|nr:Not1 N-terminal domain, CCR4-Not complex component protein [Toxoplasma gondii p89]